MFDLPSPIQEVENHPFSFRLWVKRDDLIHPLISGNKYRKLKYNLSHFGVSGAAGILSFGGVYSNHLHALAATSQYYGIPCVAIIRGEDHIPHPTLDFLKEAGLTLHFVSREAYRAKTDHPHIASILAQYPDYLILPEGGSNELALPGVAELMDEVRSQNLHPDYIAVAAGTGSTAAGILSGMKKNDCRARLMVFSALKGRFLQPHIASLAGATNEEFYFTDESSLGGYARINEDYLRFLVHFEKNSGIEVDPIYNGKVLLGLHQLDAQSFFKPQDQVLWIHTGGLQGKAGLANRMASMDKDL